MKIYACILSMMLASGALATDGSVKSGRKSIAASVRKLSKSTIAAGTVISTDIVGNTITIESRGKKKIQWLFSVPANAKITGGQKIVALRDVSIGAKISVRYAKDGDTLNAYSIKVWPPKKQD